MENEEQITEENQESVTEKREGTNGVQAPTWKYSDGVSGSGDVPAWFLADKYRTVEDQAKAALELRKKLGSKAEDAPDSYHLDYEKYGIDKEDPILAEFNPFFKEMNLPQKDYEKIIDKFVEIQSSHTENAKRQRDEAFNAFESENKGVISRLNTWAANNFDAKEQEIIKSFMNSVDEIKVLEKIRQGAPKSAPPTANQMPNQNNYESLASINNEISQNWQKIKEDANYRAVMMSKRKAAHARESG